MSILSFATVVGAALALSGQAQTPDVEASIPLIQNSYGLYTLDASVGQNLVFGGMPDADPVPFILDTGASHTTVPSLIAGQLVDPAVIDLDRIGHGTVGEFDTGLIPVNSFDFGFGPRRVDMAVVDSTNASVLTAAGLLGANAFNSEVVQLDFPASQLNLLSNVRLEGASDVRLRNGLVIGEAQVRGSVAPVKVIIDTGATASIANRYVARRPTGSVTIGNGIIDGVGGGRFERGEVRRFFPRLQVSNLCIRSFEITVADVFAFESQGWLEEPAMILGIDVLANSVITVDHATGNVRIDGQGRYACHQSG